MNSFSKEHDTLDKLNWKLLFSSNQTPNVYVSFHNEKKKRGHNNTINSFKLILFGNDNVSTQKLKARNIVLGYKEGSKIESGKFF